MIVSLNPTPKLDEFVDLNDSGARREFGTGAVRDIAEGKGGTSAVTLNALTAFNTKRSMPNTENG